jgi:hypothetical protein
MAPPHIQGLGTLFAIPESASICGTTNGRMHSCNMDGLSSDI